MGYLGLIHGQSDQRSQGFPDHTFTFHGDYIRGLLIGQQQGQVEAKDMFTFAHTFTGLA